VRHFDVFGMVVAGVFGLWFSLWLQDRVDEWTSNAGGCFMPRDKSEGDDQ
jgi:hypothetical protein